MEMRGEKRCYVDRVMKQNEWLANSMMGFHSRYQQATQVYWYPRDENQGWNYEFTVESSSHGSDESSYSRIERMLEVVLERVVSTDSGIQELKSDLLHLSQMESRKAL
ncbi:hypothetical protein HAX54_002794 [Datura stramonium]|uniref:Uncharacterized protein n=1 Tax=Datura stramonium TaxID=4076 RepID=A0ABS8WW61_DATST|nr:hypothetical protein [Datura stramonium]